MTITAVVSPTVGIEMQGYFAVKLRIAAQPCRIPWRLAEIFKFPGIILDMQSHWAPNGLRVLWEGWSQHKKLYILVLGWLPDWKCIHFPSSTYSTRNQNLVKWYYLILPFFKHGADMNTMRLLEVLVLLFAAHAYADVDQEVSQHISTPTVNAELCK